METQNQHLAKASHHVSSSLGRGAVARPSQSQTVIQAQLETTTPGDAYEQEAENTANLVMRQLSQGGDSVNPTSLHRSVPTISCSGGNPVGLSSQMESQLNTMQGGGHAMPSGLRSQMEGSFGCDFSNVRLHTDTNAAVMSSSLHANAFTHGNDIYFNQGQYQPNSSKGQHLIAHELTHTVQQSGKVGREWNDMSQSESVQQSRPTNVDPNHYPRLHAIAQSKLSQSYSNKGLTVAFLMNPNADNNNAFYDLNYEREHQQNQDLISKYPDNLMSSDALLPIQCDSVEECIAELYIAIQKYGPLQNLIISGHGNWDGIMISSDDTMVFDENGDLIEFNREYTIDESKSAYQPTIRFFKIVNELMNDAVALNPNLKGKQSIYLDSCLTNSHVYGNGMCRMSFKDVFSSYVSSDITFIANSASADDQDVYYNKDEGAIYVEDVEDPTIMDVEYNGNEHESGLPRRIANEWFLKQGFSNVIDPDNINWLKSQLDGIIKKRSSADKFLDTQAFYRIKHYCRVLKRRLDNADSDTTVDFRRLSPEVFSLSIVKILYSIDNYDFGSVSFNTTMLSAIKKAKQELNVE